MPQDVSSNCPSWAVSILVSVNNFRSPDITIDNELYNNIRISRLFEDNDIEQFVERPFV